MFGKEILMARVPMTKPKILLRNNYDWRAA